MSFQSPSFDCTSTRFEKAAIDRFRSLLSFLPETCSIYRQTWEFSTVLCLDFIERPEALAIARDRADGIIAITRELGLGHAIIFKIGNKVVEWRNTAER
jgi:hypothetical protein